MHLSLPKRFPLFILASSVFRSLQCLISALTQGGEVVSYLGSFVQVCCGEGGTLQTNITSVCGECSQCLGHTGFAPLMACMLSQSTLLSLQVALQGNFLRWTLGCVHFPGLSHSGSGSWVLHKGADSVGLCFVPFPCLSSSGNQVLGKRSLFRWGVHFITSPIPAAWFSGCAVRTPSQVCCVSLLGS